MPDRGDYLLAWFAAGTGVVLLYAAYKNVSPVSIITGRLSGDDSRTPITTTISNAFDGTITGTVGDVGTDGYSKGDTIPPSPANVARAQALQNRTAKPILVPIPSSPLNLLDSMAMLSFMKVQSEYGPIAITGAYRSTAAQAKGYADDPGRFAEPGHSAHEVGLAVDINTNKVDVNDPRLIAIMSRNGWYRVGKSGPMHWSYGVAA